MSQELLQTLARMLQEAESEIGEAFEIGGTIDSIHVALDIIQQCRRLLPPVAPPSLPQSDAEAEE